MGWWCSSNDEETEKNCIQKFIGEICTKASILKFKHTRITWRRILEKQAVRMEDKYVDNLIIVRLVKYKIMLGPTVLMGKTRNFCRIFVGKFVSNPRRLQDNIKTNLGRYVMRLGNLCQWLRIMCSDRLICQLVNSLVCQIFKPAVSYSAS
jgi:hypothetical protein